MGYARIKHVAIRRKGRIPQIPPTKFAMLASILKEISFIT